jgi:mannan endo-1,4-beta-mannosidase
MGSLLSLKGKANTKGRGITVSADTKPTGRHRPAPPNENPRLARRRWVKLAVAITAAAAVIAAGAVFAIRHTDGEPKAPTESRRHPQRHAAGLALPATPGSYIGLYPDGVPNSFAGVTAFTAATGVKPKIVSYYSGWLEPFQVSFAAMATQHGAVPLVQIDPKHTSLAAIASGQYDRYLQTYAEAVRAFRRPVIVSFGHEMNGDWYSWGYRHTPAAVFVAAWRHIVNLFRAVGVNNVTWLWTINIIHPAHGVPLPRRWWPGSSYVTWVGIDGYYRSASYEFDSLFGPTIAAVRELTQAPILLAETAVAPAADQSVKIANLFAGVHIYGLLGFVWFDSAHIVDWRISSAAAAAAFRRGAAAYDRSRS